MTDAVERRAGLAPELFLHRDGSISRLPEAAGSADPNQQHLHAAVEAVRRANYPFDPYVLPSTGYAQWQNHLDA